MAIGKLGFLPWLMVVCANAPALAASKAVTMRVRLKFMGVSVDSRMGIAKQIARPPRDESIFGSAGFTCASPPTVLRFSCCDAPGRCAAKPLRRHCEAQHCEGDAQ